MKTVLIYTLLALFIFANVACTEVGTNNKVANGDVKVAQTTTTDDEAEDEPTIDETQSETDSDEKPAPTKTPNSPEAVVENLYKEEENENSPFLQSENRALVDQFFTKELADLIWKDAVDAKDADVGALEFDPLYDAQDAEEIADLEVGNSEINGEKATVNVTFLNSGEETMLKYQLTKENGKWKIADINYGEDSLVKIYNGEKRTETKNEEN